MSVFDLFDTWLGFLGIVVGLVLAAFNGWRPLRSAVVGFAGGVALVAILNATMGNVPACLQESKGRDILRAYSIKCPDHDKDLLPGVPRK